MLDFIKSINKYVLGSLIVIILTGIIIFSPRSWSTIKLNHSMKQTERMIINLEEGDLTSLPLNKYNDLHNLDSVLSVRYDSYVENHRTSLKTINKQLKVLSIRVDVVSVLINIVETK